MVNDSWSAINDSLIAIAESLIAAGYRGGTGDLFVVCDMNSIGILITALSFRSANRQFSGVIPDSLIAINDSWIAINDFWIAIDDS